MKKNYFLKMNADEGLGLGGATAPVAPAGGTVAASTPPAASIQWPENWKEGLPEDIRGEDSLKTVADIPSLAKSYIHAQRAIGRNKIVVPDQHATDEDWAQVFQKLGVPQDVKDYSIKAPPAFEKEDAFLNHYKEAAHKMGILPKQAEGMLKWYAELDQEMSKTQTEAQMNEINRQFGELKASLGAGWDRHWALANKAVQDVGGEELVKFMNESGLSKNVTLIKTFMEVGKKLYGEDAIPDAQGHSGLTPQEAQSRWQEIQGNPSHPYWQGSHPSHKKAVQEVEQLFAFMTPPKKA